MAASDSSILFEIEDSTFSATFYEVDNSGKGEAEGPVFFQRRGDVQFLLDELYGDKSIIFTNNPADRANYEIEMRWSEGINFESIRDTVISALKQELGFTTEADSVMEKVYVLSVKDDSILREAVADELSEGVAYKSSAEGDRWNIVATLPRFADELSQKLDVWIQVQTGKTGDTTLYNFDLDTQDNIDELEKQLENDYGLTFDIGEKRVEQIQIKFEER